MFKNTALVFLLVLILLMVSTVTPAQTDPTPQPELPISDIPFIDRVTLERNTTTDIPHLEVWVRGYWSGSCDGPVLIEHGYHAGWLWVEIQRTAPPGGSCDSPGDPSFSEVIVLSDQISSALDQYLWVNNPLLVVEVNDFIGFAMPPRLFTATVVTPPPTDSTTPSAPSLPEFYPNTYSVVPTERQMVSDVTVEVNMSERPLMLTISGHHPDGCKKPIRARYQREGDTIMVDVYRVEPHNQGGLCPAVMVSYTLNLPLEEDLVPGTYTYMVNGVEGTFDTETPASDDRYQSVHVIENVDVLIMESFPPQINLVVSGYIPDGCEFATQVDSQRQNNTVSVQIFRELPLYIDCPMMVVDYSDTIALGTFNPGQYTFEVNGMVVAVEVE